MRCEQPFHRRCKAMKTTSDKSGNGFNRRRFLGNASALTAASLLGLPRASAAEPPPETTRIRLTHFPAICTTPKYLAEEFLRMEGFTNVEYVDLSVNTTTPLVDGGIVDMDFEAAPRLVASLDCREYRGARRRHAGCYELFGSERSALSATKAKLYPSVRSVPSSVFVSASLRTWAWIRRRTSTGL